MALLKAQPPTAALDDDFAAQAVPLSQKSAVEVALADIPMPPEHLVDELDNSKPAAEEVDTPTDLVTLDFCGDELPHREFKLRYPFRWDGARFDAVTVRQLTTAEVGRIAGDWNRTSKAPDLYDLYAVMTGLPAKVLRALPSVDGEPIIDQAFDFLPRLFRPADG